MVSALSRCPLNVWVDQICGILGGMKAECVGIQSNNSLASLKCSENQKRIGGGVSAWRPLCGGSLLLIHPEGICGEREGCTLLVVYFLQL